MVKARRLKSGKWNIQAFSHKENGKPIYKSITADTKLECESLYIEFKKNRNVRPATRQTVRDAVAEYIDLSRTILSPTSIAGYERVMKYAFPDLMGIRVDKLNNNVVQLAINQECKRVNHKTGETLSAKTIKNEWGLVSSALKAKGYVFAVRLPKCQHKNLILPEPAIIISIVKDTPLELPCLLAMWCSLRLSEVCGLTCADINGDTLCVNQVRVRVNSTDYTKRLAKTDASIRIVALPPYIKQLIENTETMIKYRQTNENDFLLPVPTYYIANTFIRTMRKNKLDISFHDLRHYYATIGLLTMPSKVVQKNGGWSSPTIMQNVYNNIITEEERKAQLTFNAYYEKILNGILNRGVCEDKNVEISMIKEAGVVGSIPIIRSNNTEDTEE